MQNNLLVAFEDEIQSIQEYIKHIKLIDDIAKEYSSSDEMVLKAFNSHLIRFKVDKKVFEYKSIIISLYGVLENHIGLWLKAHISNINQLLSTYDELPPKIQDAHFKLSIKLISLLSEHKYSKYEEQDKEKVLVNLASCFNTTNYQLNKDAFLPSSGNLKHQKIVEAFKTINIDLTAKLKKNKDLLSLLQETYGECIENRDNKLFQLIDDLVTRRNDIAHGSKIDELLGIEHFNDYINFLKIYGKAIFETLIEKEISYEINDYQAIEASKIKHIYNHSILCFTLENYTMKKGDYIIIKKSNNDLLKKKILNIQINNKEFDKIEITSATNIAINLENGLNNNQVFFLKNKK